MLFINIIYKSFIYFPSMVYALFISSYKWQFKYCKLCDGYIRLHSGRIFIWASSHVYKDALLLCVRTPQCCLSTRIGNCTS